VCLGLLILLAEKASRPCVMPITRTEEIWVLLAAKLSLTAVVGSPVLKFVCKNECAEIAKLVIRRSKNRALRFTMIANFPFAYRSGNLL
jgi:hypothetical protein